MSKLDEIKEVLNTLRVAMSLAFGILIFLIGAIVKRYDKNNVDDIFWLGIICIALDLIAILYVVLKITKKTKQIGKL